MFNGNLCNSRSWGSLSLPESDVSCSAGTGPANNDSSSESSNVSPSSIAANDR